MRLTAAATFVAEAYEGKDAEPDTTTLSRNSEERMSDRPSSPIKPKRTSGVWLGREKQSVGESPFRSLESKAPPAVSPELFLSRQAHRPRRRGSSMRNRLAQPLALILLDHFTSFHVIQAEFSDSVGPRKSWSTVSTLYGIEAHLSQGAAASLGSNGHHLEGSFKQSLL